MIVSRERDFSHSNYMRRGTLTCNANNDHDHGVIVRILPNMGVQLCVVGFNAPLFWMALQLERESAADRSFNENSF